MDASAEFRLQQQRSFIELGGIGERNVEATRANSRLKFAARALGDFPALVNNGDAGRQLVRLV